nr:lipid-binding protein [uncultured Flavobacterium sp.]
MKIFNIKSCALALTIALSATLISCEEDGYADYNPGGDAAQSMSGEWYINIYDEASGDIQVENALHRTYGDNNGGLWISDRANATQFYGWWLESTVSINTSDLTFSGNDRPNFADDSEVTITEGKIIKGGGHSTTGVVVDSIYFKGVFNYDPGTTLIFAGHGRTGFEEDEH